MEQLKVIDLGNIRESIEKDEPVYYEYYAKSEADKAIAELEAQKAQAEDDCAYWKTMSRKCTDDNEVMAKQRADAFKRERHQKYKRCLAMAKLCRSEWAAAIFIPEKGGTDKQAALYMKWEKRWRALANKYKYKEAK